MDINSNINKINIEAESPVGVDSSQRSVFSNSAGLNPTGSNDQFETEPPVPAVDQTEATDTVSRENLEEAVRNVSEHVQNLQRTLQFRVDDISGRSVVTVLDTETEEVIRQIPSDEMLVLSHKLAQLREQGEIGFLIETLV